MRKQRVEKVSEYAYFMVDEGSFVNTILPYDPLLANLAISVEEEPVLESKQKGSKPLKEEAFLAYLGWSPT